MGVSKCIIFIIYCIFISVIVLLVKGNTFGDIHRVLIAMIIVFILFLCSILTIRGEDITPTVPTQSINSDLVESSSPPDPMVTTAESPSCCEEVVDINSN